ncbi:unnamed protein product, partial [Prorocentrum cordatum]
AMLGVQSKRNATIIAGSMCSVWEIEHSDVRGILERHQMERQNFLHLVEEHLDRQVASRIVEHPLFAGFHQQFRTLIGVNCERRLYFAGEAVVREGVVGDRLFVFNLGAARVEMLGQRLASVQGGGAHFGFAMLRPVGVTKERYAVTVTAETMCQVLMVTRSSFEHALNKYPEMREAARALELEESRRYRWQVDRARSLVKTQVQRSQNLRCIMEAFGGVVLTRGASEDSETRRQIERAFFEAWRGQASRAAEARREAESFRASGERHIEKWLVRRRAQMSEAKRRRASLDGGTEEEPPPPAWAAAPRSAREARPRHQPVPVDAGGSPYLSPVPLWRRAPPAQLWQPQPPAIPLPLWPSRRPVTAPEPAGAAAAAGGAAA